MNRSPLASLRWFLALLLVGGLSSAKACDPDHDWDIVVASSERQPELRLLADMILKALRDASSPLEAVALLPIDDRYGMAPGTVLPGSEPARLPPKAITLQAKIVRKNLQDLLSHSEFIPLPLDQVDAALHRQGPAAKFDPRIFQELEAAARQALFVRLVLLNYSRDVTLERDRSPKNPHLFRETYRQKVQLRVAIQNSAGEYLFLEQLEGQALQEAMFYERPGEARFPVETRSSPYHGPESEWHKGLGEIREGGSLGDLLQEIDSRETRVPQP